MFTSWVESPFEGVAVDHHRPVEFAVPHTLLGGTNIDDQRATSALALQRFRRDAIESGAYLGQDVVDRVLCADDVGSWQWDSGTDAELVALWVRHRDPAFVAGSADFDAGGADAFQSFCLELDVVGADVEMDAGLDRLWVRDPLQDDRRKAGDRRGEQIVRLEPSHFLVPQSRCPEGGEAFRIGAVDDDIDVWLHLGWVSYMRTATTNPDTAVSAATAQIATRGEKRSARTPARMAPTAKPASRQSR